MGDIHAGCGCWVSDLHSMLLTDDLHKKINSLNARNFIKLYWTIKFKLRPFKCVCNADFNALWTINLGKD